MRIIEFGIKHFRSIENILLKFPKNKPLILFGPNNAGKTNILTALNIALGESFPTYREMDESDYYFRDKAHYPEIDFYCSFDGDYYVSRYSTSKDIFHIITIMDFQKKTSFMMEIIINFIFLLKIVPNVKRYILMQLETYPIHLVIHLNIRYLANFRYKFINL